MERIVRVQYALEGMNPTDPDGEALIVYSRDRLERAERAARKSDFFAADRLTAAADALFHAAEHLQHLREARRGPTPPAPVIGEHLQHVYFRLQQAEYFARIAEDSEAKRLPALATKFYEEALRGYDKGDLSAADEYAKAADDTIRGLESLAQAATPLPRLPR
jgi:hypothetical protein